MPHKTIYDPSRVSVILLMGTDSDAQYAALKTASKVQTNHLYILKNGKGYLGEEPLFGGDAERFEIIDADEVDASHYITITPEANKIYYILANNAKYSATISGTPTDVPLDQGKLYHYDGTNFVDLDYVAFQTMIAKYITDQAIHAAIRSGGTVTGGIDNTHDELTIPTTGAVYDFITNQSIMSAQFFRMVKEHTVDSTDLANVLLTGSGDPNENGEYDWVYSDNAHTTTYAEGTHGLLFTLDNDSVPGGESYYFIDLTNYIKEIDIENTDSIHLDVATSTNSHRIKADLNIRTGENSLLIDDGTGTGSLGAGVYLDKTTSSVNTSTHTYTHDIHTIDATNTTSEAVMAAASPTKLVTEQALVVYMETFFKDYIDGLLDDFVTYDVDSTTGATQYAANVPATSGGSGT